MKKLLSKLKNKKIINLILYAVLFWLVIQFFYYYGEWFNCHNCSYEAGTIGFILVNIIFPADFSLKLTFVLGIAFLLFFFYSPLVIWLFFLFIFLLPLDFLPVYLIFFSILISFFSLRFALSFLFFKAIKKLKLLPRISQTERIALQVGETWLEKEFFTGRPNFKTLLKQKIPFLSTEEKDFIDKPLQNFCSLSNEWDFLKRKRLTQKEEEFIKKEKLFGLIIPKEYKGLAFSPFAHAKVIEKVASHNIPLSIIAMVPNSLGPAELLLKYGTKEQKDKYLDSLASAEIWPCFGLTEPQAGSDASSIQSEGILFKDGESLKIRLNFEKRWITLSPKADLIGLAVRLKDPEQIYSEKKDLGITCLLLSSQLKGIEKGFYHEPMALPIYNAPIKGKDVVVLAESAIIGGMQGAGQGWKMLMESLSIGRSISLPSLAVACGKRVSFLVGTHAFIRKQFGQPIGSFSAIQEKLAKIIGLTHLMSSAQAFTLSGLNQGIVSPVVSAFTKYQLTEMAQKVVKQGMDIMGGAGLSLGPKNKIALLHNALPVAITVEGANTLTRTFIVYGQGLIKTHPHVYNIIQAIENNNLKSFHKNFWSFLYHTLCHFVRACFFTLTRAYFAQFFLFITNAFKSLTAVLSSKNNKKTTSFSESESNKLSLYKHRYLQKLAWSASLFAFLSNLNLLCLGGKLKTKGEFNGRFADWLSFQYMISAVLWQSKKGESSCFVEKWALDYCFLQIQNSLRDILNNYPITAIRWLLKPLNWILRISPLGFKPSDKLNTKLAQQLLEDKEFKNKLCENMYFPSDPEDQFQKLKKAYDLSLKERDILDKLSLKTSKAKFKDYQEALNSSLISKEEFETLKSAKKAQWEAIQVDAFSEEEYFKGRL